MQWHYPFKRKITHTLTHTLNKSTASPKTTKGNIRPLATTRLIDIIREGREREPFPSFLHMEDLHCNGWGMVYSKKKSWQERIDPELAHIHIFISLSSAGALQHATHAESLPPSGAEACVCEVCWSEKKHSRSSADKEWPGVSPGHERGQGWLPTSSRQCEK